MELIVESLQNILSNSHLLSLAITQDWPEICSRYLHIPLQSPAPLTIHVSSTQIAASLQNSDGHYFDLFPDHMVTLLMLNLSRLLGLPRIRTACGH